jgi:hypothetical protein
MALKARKRILLSYDSKVCEKPWRVFKQKTELAAFVFWEHFGCAMENGCKGIYN